MTVLPGTRSRVKWDDEPEGLAHLSGKMRKRFVRRTTGDRVRLGLSPYDLTKARIAYRVLEAVSMQSTEPLTPALSPSDGERECASAPVERSLFSDPIHTQANVLPLPFLKGDGRGEGSRPSHRYG